MPEPGAEHGAPGEGGGAVRRWIINVGGRVLAGHVQQPDQLGGLPEVQAEVGAALLEAKLEGAGDHRAQCGVPPAGQLHPNHHAGRI